jgi:hypothetical protein
VGWYLARMFIGLLVGITSLPPQWYLRGSLRPARDGAAGVVSLGIPGCGFP